MSTSQESPDLIQYACERCKTRFVLPPSSRQLGIVGKARAFGTGLGRTLRYRDGLGAGYEAAQRNLLAKSDDKAYQSFVQSFRFCHECRQFVCNECWSDSRRSCLTCVAKAMTGAARPRPPFAPVGPEIPRPAPAAGPGRSRRVRRDLALVALAIGLILVAVEVGVLFAGAGGPNVASVEATPTPSATAQPSPSETPTAIPTESPTPTESLTPTAAPTPTPTAAATPTATPSPTPTPVASPTPTPRVTPKVTPRVTPPPPTPAPTMPTLPTPAINCINDGAQWTCNWTNQGDMPNATATWWEDTGTGSFQSFPDFFAQLPVPGGPYRAYLQVTQAGLTSAQSVILTGP
ncbi:MAG: hypothetical protein ACXWNR_02640 [Candidatus Limnocylindrales bacterium]